MKRVALVNKQNSTVDNCINLAVSDDRTESDTHWFVALDDGQIIEIGNSFTPIDDDNPALGGEFSQIQQPQPSEPVPEIIDNWRAKAVLARRGKIAAVQAWIDRPETPNDIKYAWENAPFHRNSPTVISVGEMLELSSAELDAMFIEAINIFF